MHSTPRGGDFIATDLESVVTTPVHYFTIDQKIASDVVQKRGNHRDELGGVKNHMLGVMPTLDEADDCCRQAKTNSSL
jgi:hypothetical protein